jgi:hypothetical protein
MLDAEPQCLSYNQVLCYRDRLDVKANFESYGASLRSYEIDSTIYNSLYLLTSLASEKTADIDLCRVVFALTSSRSKLNTTRRQHPC